MTTPTIFSAEYADANALYRAPKRVDGGATHERVTATIPAGTVVTTNVGLIPFAKGAKIAPYASSILCGDGDTATTATIDIGWIYDDAVTYTSDPDGFLAASTAPQTGVAAALTAVAGFGFVAQAPGWIVAVPTGETVEVAYTVIADVVISYN